MQQPVYQNPNTPTVEQTYRTNLIIWGAMIFSQLMFVVLIFMVKRELFDFDALTQTPTQINAVIGVLAFAALTTFVLSFILKARFLRLAVRDKNIAMVQTAYILAYALCEAATLFGLVAAFAFDFRWFFLWFVVGIGGILLHFPRRENFNAAAFTGIKLN